MQFSLIVLVFMPFVAHVLSLDCTKVANGNYNIGCKYYVQCQDGVKTVVQCSHNTAYNYNTGKCENEMHVPSPCNANHEPCKGRKDGGHALKDCRDFIICLNEKKIGGMRCPLGLVYNNEDQYCDWRRNTKKPCGTKN